MSIQNIGRLIVALGLFSASVAYAEVKEYHLVIDEQNINLTGKTVKKIHVNGQFPAPTLEFEEGDEAVIHVQNNLKKQETSVHWHGLLLPGLMDGVPGFNQYQAIQPNQSFTYKFKIRQSGTYWYHAHSKGQEQDGLYGAFIIHPKKAFALAEHEKVDRDYVVMLSDFHESSSAQILANLKKDNEFYQNQRETVKDVWQQIQNMGLKQTWKQRSMWNQMRMMRTDLSDVSGYTFLVNGQTPQQNWTANFKPNEKVRLRIINASAMSFFDVRIPNLKMLVVSADGQPVQPVTVDEFRIGAAETYDVIVQPQQALYQLQAESIDRNGFAIATLKNQQLNNHQVLPIPSARPRAVLSMEDMGHTHAKYQVSQVLNREMPSSELTNQSQHIDHSTMQHHAMPMPDESDHTALHQHAMPEVSEHQITNSKTEIKNVEGWANASTPYGHKALAYADLKSLEPQADQRAAEREIEIVLGGTMERYIWTINGEKYNQTQPLQVKFGERVRLKFINNSMMAHPMHLHGMFMQLENGQPISELPNKHTIVVPPGKTITALLTADELGEWAIHCHLLYHMSAGMMSKLIVAQVDDTQPKALHIATINPLHDLNKTEGGQHEHH